METSTEIQTRIEASQTRLDALSSQMSNFAAQLDVAADKEAMVRDRVRLGIDDASAITEPRETKANLLSVLTEVESEIETLTMEIEADKIALKSEQIFERMTNAANTANDCAREFHEAREALAAAMKTGLNQLIEIQGRWERAGADFVVGASAHASEFPVPVPRFHTALSRGEYHAGRVVSAEAVSIALSARGVDLGNVEFRMAGFDNSGLVRNKPMTKAFGEASRLAGTVNRAMDEYKNPGTPLF